MWPSVKVVAAIPSRFHSSRFPGKALIPLLGVPLIARVAKQVVESGVAHRVIVATDDRRIARAVETTGAQVHLSHRAFVCGTDRVAEAVDTLDPAADTIINVQGDEPLVDAKMLRAALEALEGHDVGTVAVPPAPGQDLTNPDTVKVLVDPRGRARSFGRAADPGAGQPLVHVGIYAFKRATLGRFASLPVCDAERRWGLEQLRAMEAGMTVGVVSVARTLQSVNRPGDVPLVERLLAPQKRRVNM